MIFTPESADFIPDKTNGCLGLRFNSDTGSVTIPMSWEFADDIGECLQSFVAIYRKD